MRLPLRRRFRFIRDKRGFTRLEFGLLTGMLFAMIVNGIATLGGGLGSSSRPMGNATADDNRTLADAHPQAGPPHWH